MHLTKRPVVDELEEILFELLPVLDHGFVRVVDYYGNDDAIVQAARVSYGKGTKKKSADNALIRYLMRHDHTSPFEMCDIKLHIKCPIFVARQWLRHRTASVNEYSARYSIMKDEFYTPEKENIAKQSENNKQGRGDSIENANHIIEKIDNHNNKSYELYDYFLNDDINLSRETARSVLPVNVYTEFYWKINLHNLLHFLRLRADSHAQYEIRVFAEMIESIVKKWVPVTYEAYEDYRKESIKFTKNEFNYIKSLLQKREKTELLDKLSSREKKKLLYLLKENCI